MNIFKTIILPILVAPFWAAVLAFIPIIIHLIRNPLYSIRAELAFKKKIFLLQQDEQLQKERKSRLKGVKIIYGVCLGLFLGVGLINWILNGSFGLHPLDIISSTSVILFCFAVVTYLPFAAYLILKDPWRYKEEGPILTEIFVFYGGAILVFALIYFGYWLKSHAISLEIIEFLKSFFILIFASATISYLPILVYVFIQVKNPVRKKPIKLRIVFFIYCISFFLFSAVYMTNWYSAHVAPPDFVNLSE